MEIAPGAVHLHHYLRLDAQRAIVEQCRALVDGPVPAYVPIVRGGGRMRVRMLCLGRHWNGKTYRYEETRSDFDAEVEREQRPAERARGEVHLAQDVGEAEPVDESEGERDPGADVAAAAHQQVVGADVDDAERDRGLDQTRRRRHDVQRRERQRDAVRDRERRHHQRQLTDGPAEQQQADEKQQVVGTDQDVVHT